MKICFAASSGGHLEQLLMLKPLMNQYESFIVTEQTKYEMKLIDIPTYNLLQINRKEKGVLLRLFINTVISLIIFIREMPDVIISTGVLATIPICLISKIFRKKLIYLESFAKVKTATETGKLVYKFADRFYVQWEEMLNVYPHAIFKGGIY